MFFDIGSNYYDFMGVNVLMIQRSVHKDLEEIKFLLAFIGAILLIGLVIGVWVVW